MYIELDDDGEEIEVDCYCGDDECCPECGGCPNCGNCYCDGDDDWLGDDC